MEKERKKRERKGEKEWVTETCLFVLLFAVEKRVEFMYPSNYCLCGGFWQPFQLGLEESSSRMKTERVSIALDRDKYGIYMWNLLR